MSVLMWISFTFVVAKVLYLRINLFVLTYALQLNELPGYAMLAGVNLQVGRTKNLGQLSWWKIEKKGGFIHVWCFKLITCFLFYVGIWYVRNITSFGRYTESCAAECNSAIIEMSFIVVKLFIYSSSVSKLGRCSCSKNFWGQYSVANGLLLWSLMQFWYFLWHRI